MGSFLTNTPSTPTLRSRLFASLLKRNQAGHLRPSSPKLGFGALPGIVRVCTKAAHRRAVSTATYSRQKETAQTNSSRRASVHSSKTRRSPQELWPRHVRVRDVRIPGKSAIERRSGLRPTRNPVDWKWSETRFQNSLRTSVAGDSDTTQISHQKKNLRKPRKWVQETAFRTCPGENLLAHLHKDGAPVMQTSGKHSKGFRSCRQIEPNLAKDSDVLNIHFNKTALFRKKTRKELQDHAAKTQDTSVDPLRTRRWP